MKLFISMPITGKSTEKIGVLKERYHKFCESTIFGEKVVCLKGWEGESLANRMGRLVEDLKTMGKADFVFFAPYWNEDKDCEILKAVCEAYHIDHTDGNAWAEYIEDNLENITLRECPHCGADCGFLARMSEVNADTDSEVHYVICCNCGARSGRAATKAEADEEWNRRVTDDNSDTTTLQAVDVRM